LHVFFQDEDEEMESVAEKKEEAKKEVETEN
jgi:hypothetical protein